MKLLGFKTKGNKKKFYFLGIRIFSFNYKVLDIKKQLKKKSRCERENFGLSFNDDKCIILANGPSLNNSIENEKENSFIKKYPIFAVNNFPLTSYFFSYKPSCLFYMDPLFWDRNVDDKRQELNGSLSLALKKVDWNLKVFMPRAAEKWNFLTETISQNHNLSIIYLETSPAVTSKKFLEYKYNLSSPQMYNVIIGATYVAINAGFKEVYIYGLDMSYNESFIVPGDNNLYCKSKYFYGDLSENERVYPLINNPEISQMAMIYAGLSKVFLEFKELNKYAEYNGCKIYNMNEYSYIDAFEKRI